MTHAQRSWHPDDDSDDDTPYGRYADHTVRARPNPKANRPRTKRRPEHRSAVTGMVIAVDRGRYTVQIMAGSDSEHPEERRIIAARARELHRTAIVIGDRVGVVGDTSGAAGSLARIVSFQDRQTVLRRSADDSDRLERVMVANADQMLIVVAAADPEPRVRLVDRYLVAAYDAGIQPMLCVTKVDLADPTSFLAHFSALDVPVFRVALRESNAVLADIHDALQGKTTVFVGHSGVGKSTLMNALVPAAQRATGHVNEVTGRGRHTSSSSMAFELPRLSMNLEGSEHAANVLSDPPSWVIDTPGIRSFGLGHVTGDSILRGFTDLRDVLDACPRGCAHTSESPGCELDCAIADGRLDATGAARVESLRRLMK